MRSIVWFTEDLRVQDNSALFEATEASFDGIVGLYIVDEALWKNNASAPCRVEFLLRGLEELRGTLAKLNMPLLIRQVKNTEEVPKAILAVVEQVKASAVFYNHQYELAEQQRNKAVCTLLEQHRIKTYGYHDQVILPPRDDHTKTFATFKKLWVKKFIQQGGLRLCPPIYEQRTQENIISDPLPVPSLQFRSSIDPKLWPAGEKEAHKQLKYFIEEKIPTYDTIHDYPFLDGTSKLSPYLSTGMISPRQCFLAALETNDYRLGDGKLGAITWMNELIWRDFFKHLVFTVPRISLHQAYQEQTENVAWAFDEKQYQAWTEGQTGFPIVDAAMRQLQATGWMHDRLRIITATFFTKYLFFDWRLGEEFFMRHLIDGDFAINNGNWQLCASTGPDTSAYFRYFDPLRQSDRYDPEGQFIKQYCPELTDITGYAVHLPHTRSPVQAQRTTYPKPIIDLKTSRNKAIVAFRSGIKKKI